MLKIDNVLRSGYYLAAASITDTDNNIVGNINCSGHHDVNMVSLPDYNEPPHIGWETNGRNMSTLVYIEAGGNLSILFARYGGAVQKYVTASIAEL